MNKRTAERYTTLLMQIFMIFSAALSLTACSSNEPAGDNTRMVDQSRIELSESAVAVNHSLQTMASLEQSQQLIEVQEALPDPMTYGMGDIVSVDWVGPVEPLIKKLAIMSSYRVNVIGNPPSIPVIVSINQRDMAIGEILRDALLQSRSQVDVQVYPENQLIELRYL